MDPQNGHLRWLLDDLDCRRAFEFLWIPPSIRYYDAGSVYESAEATGFTKRLIFSGWTVVPKVVSSLISFEAERHAYAARDHRYTAEYGKRGGGRLTFRTPDRGSTTPRPGENPGKKRAGSMTAFLLLWPSPTLAAIGDPRTGGAGRGALADLQAAVEGRVERALEPLVRSASGADEDRRWYWAAPLLLDEESRDSLLHYDEAVIPGQETAGAGFEVHIREALSMIEAGPAALGRPPDDLAAVLAGVAIGGPAQCALRAISGVSGLELKNEDSLHNAAFVASAFRDFFNAPEVTGVITRGGGERAEDDDQGRTGFYWREVVSHCVEGNLQAVLDEHLHVLRDWLGFIEMRDEERRVDAANEISTKLGRGPRTTDLWFPC